MKYAVITTDTIQTSEDTWRPVKRVLSVTPNTTIADVLVWYAKIFPRRTKIEDVELVAVDEDGD